MKIIILLFSLYLVSIEISYVHTLESGTDDDDYRWSWGVVKEEATTVPPGKGSLVEEPNHETTPELMPSLNVSDNLHVKRISEIKCDEYKLNNIDLGKKRIEKENSNPFNWVIGGGFDAEPDEYPHMCALGWKTVVGSWSFKCGGTLISPTFVLTAAHCTQATPDTTITDVEPEIIRFPYKNLINVSPDIKAIEPRDANIKRMIVHPQYKSPKKYYDIALVEVDKEFAFDRKVQPACLWTNFDTSPLGKKAYVTGWGVLESGTFKTKPVLQKAELDFIDSKTCDQLLRPKCNRHWCGVEDTQICAGVLSGGIDTCQGDSGGPLQVKIDLPLEAEGAMYYVVGVTSFGFGCLEKNTPGIYTRVSAFVDWIERNVWQ